MVWRNVWFGGKEIASIFHCCIPCQVSNVHRYNNALLLHTCHQTNVFPHTCRSRLTPPTITESYLLTVFAISPDT